MSRRTVGDLPPLASQVEAFGAVLWALFFLIPVGRAEADETLEAGAIEDMLEWAAGLVGRVPFGIKTTEAPHFHRVLARRAVSVPSATAGVPRAITGSPGRASGAPGVADQVRRAGRAVTDGNGFVFIDHVGNICPSGFLPLARGNVRTDDLVTTYRDDATFVALRDPDRLGGRCGRCEYRPVCGGSRARAYAVAGDPLVEDPGCAWSPAPRATLPIAGGSDAATPVSEADVMRALGTVLDPELGMSIVDLGLVYDVCVRPGAVGVTMTLTAPGCPIHDAMQDWVRAAVLGVPGVEHVEVTLTFDPPWTPERIRR